MKRLAALMMTMILLLPLLMQTNAYAEDKQAVITKEQMLQLNLALEDESKELPVGEEFRLSVNPGDLSVVKGLDKDWMNILILGTDTGNLKLNYGRTDAMIIASVNVKTGKMKLTSIVRDLFVNIPMLKNQNRINTANAFGGPLLAVKTVNEVLGLNIERYCSINFRGFSNIVDYMGGVELTLGADESELAGVLFSDKPQVLNGDQALAYARIRKTDNNFGRNERQRKLLGSMLDQLKKSDMPTIMGAVTETFKAIATNLTTSEVVSLLPAVLRNADALDMLSLPVDGEYSYFTTDWGASVVLYDELKLKEAFHGFVYSD